MAEIVALGVLSGRRSRSPRAPRGFSPNGTSRARRSFRRSFDRSPPPLYIAYNSRREERLLEAMAEQRLQRRFQLGYLSVKANTQQHLWLYGPPEELGGATNEDS